MQRVPVHRADNRECPTTELATMMSQGTVPQNPYFCSLWKNFLPMPLVNVVLVVLVVLIVVVAIVVAISVFLTQHVCLLN